MESGTSAPGLGFLLAQAQHRARRDAGPDSELGQDVPRLAAQIGVGWKDGWRPPAEILIFVAVVLGAGLLAALRWGSGGIVLQRRGEIPLAWQVPAPRIIDSANIPSAPAPAATLTALAAALPALAVSVRAPDALPVQPAPPIAASAEILVILHAHGRTTERAARDVAMRLSASGRTAQLIHSTRRPPASEWIGYYYDEDATHAAALSKALGIAQAPRLIAGSDGVFHKPGEMLVTLP